MLLGVGGALYSVAVIRTGVASRWFGLAGVAAAVAGGFFGVVVAAAPHFGDLQALAQRGVGLVVLWDLWAAIVMLGFRDGSS